MSDEKTTFGVVIEKATPPPTANTTNHPYTQVQPLRTQVSANTLSPDTDHEDSREATPAVDTDPSNPFSAFYNHPTTRTSLEQSRSKVNLGVYHHDLETGGSTAQFSHVSGKPEVSVDGRVKECTVWPSKQTLREKAKSRKRERGCNPMRNFSKKQKMWCKILIALLIIGAATGIGVGISKAVGGGVWAGNGQSKQIGDDDGTS